MIETWTPEDDKKAAAVKRISDILTRIANQGDTLKTLIAVEGAVEKLEHGQPFQAAYLMSRHAELTEGARGATI